MKGDAKISQLSYLFYFFDLTVRNFRSNFHVLQQTCEMRYTNNRQM